jgi:hypothetical protein
MSFKDTFIKHPYFLYTFGDVIILVAEAFIELMTYPYRGPSPPFTSVLPRNTMIVAAIYDIAITSFPIMMTINHRNAIKWGYLTAIFGFAGEYININNPISGVAFFVILLSGLAPAITARRKNKMAKAKVL